MRLTNINGTVEKDDDGDDKIYSKLKENRSNSKGVLIPKSQRLVMLSTP